MHSLFVHRSVPPLTCSCLSVRALLLLVVCCCCFSAAFDLSTAQINSVVCVCASAFRFSSSGSAAVHKASSTHAQAGVLLLPNQSAGQRSPLLPLSYCSYSKRGVSSATATAAAAAVVLAHKCMCHSYCCCSSCCCSSCCLSALATDAACQLDVLWHDGHALGVDGAQVGVLEQTHQVCL
jgi:hypothetical protein